MTTEEENKIKRETLLSAIEKGHTEFYKFEKDSRFPINLSTKLPRGEVIHKRYLVIDDTGSALDRAKREEVIEKVKSGKTYNYNQIKKDHSKYCGVPEGAYR